MVACVIIIVVSVTTAGTWDSDSGSQTLQWPLIRPGEEAGFLPLLLASHCDLLGDVVALEFHQLLELLSFIFPILFLAFRSPSMELCYVSLLPTQVPTGLRAWFDTISEDLPQSLQTPKICIWPVARLYIIRRHRVMHANEV